MGILNTKALWATDVWYMKDTGEATSRRKNQRFIDSCAPETDDMRSLSSMSR